jgi:heterodisulfide reductase subunit B
MNVELEELPDWNCCGATSYISIDEMKAFALAARNLAIADEQANGEPSIDMIAPCNACYLGLKKVQHYLEEYEPIADKIHSALHKAGLNYTGKVRIRHPVDILVNDIEFDTLSNYVKKPLKGLKVASYYGCQMVRPYSTFDDQENPTTMDRLMELIGAESVDWPLKTRCCGGTLTGTVQEVGLELNYILLKEAVKRGADVIATNCSLCQFNLECYQDRIKRRFKDLTPIPIVYFTQLLGKAMGIPEKSLGLHRMFIRLKV